MPGSRTQATTVSERPEPSRTEWGDQLIQPSGRGAAAWDAATRVLRPSPRSVTEARSFVTETLRGWGLGEFGDDVELVVCELVTNALRAGSGPAVLDDAVLEDVAGAAEPSLPPPDQERQSPIQLKLVRKGWHVMCLVGDPSDEAPVRTELGDDPAFPPDAGRGLYLVHAYCRRWGWARLRGGGKVVWALFHAPQ